MGEVFVEGFGVSVSKKSERLVVKKKGEVIFERPFFDAFLGLSHHLSTDLLNLGEPCILNIIFNDHKRDFHQLTLAGYALVLEAVYEFPVDVGVTVYASFERDRLHIEREFAVLGDELRMEFVEIRDEKQRMGADELDPGPCESCEEWCAR